jgi:hypothetical protein
MAGQMTRRYRTRLAAVGMALVATTATPGACTHRGGAGLSSSPSGTATAEPKPGTLPASIASFFGSGLVVENFGSFGADRSSIVSSGDSRFPAALRVRYPADSASQLAAATADTAHGGAQFYLRWTRGQVDDAYLAYRLRLPAGFNFVKGGKLPGLYGGRRTSGRKIPDGTNGFSTRYMWRTAGAGEVYAYLPTSVAHGTSLGRGNWSWPTGRWASVQQHVHLNRPGSSDGEVQVWLDGQPVLDQQGLIFRTTTDLRIQGLFFSTFFGGGDASWATPVDQFADFADFRLGTRPMGD